MIETTQINCPSCGVQPYTRDKPNHILHLLLTALTCTAWLFIWIPVILWGASAFRCASCGKTRGRAGRAVIRAAKLHRKNRALKPGTRITVVSGTYCGRYGTLKGFDELDNAIISDRRGKLIRVLIKDIKKV